MQRWIHEMQQFIDSYLERIDQFLEIPEGHLARWIFVNRNSWKLRKSNALIIGNLVRETLC